MTRLSNKQFNEYLESRGVKWPWELPEGEDPAPNKYKNVKTEIDGIYFDSKKEADYYLYLKLQKGGSIKDFEVKPEKFILQPGFRNNSGRWIRPITYTADFKVIYQDGTIEYIDTKGFRTEKFDLKFKMFQYNFPDITLRLV